MHVPLFPRPPAVGSVATPISDVPDIATLPRTPLSVVAVPRKRHAVDPRSSLIFRTRKQHRRLCRNLVYPRVKNASTLFKDAAAHRSITEFRVRMMEHHAKDDERDDDDDVICAVGRCYSNYYKSNFNLYIYNINKILKK